jgi:hypothetical protein
MDGKILILLYIVLQLLRVTYNRRPEDVGLKTPKNVASLIDVNNKEIELRYTEYCVILIYVDVYYG